MKQKTIPDEEDADRSVSTSESMPFNKIISENKGL